MSKKKKLIIIISIITLVIGALLFCVFYFFLPKKYTFYIKEDIGELQAIMMKYDGDAGNKQGYWLYNIAIVDEFIEELDDVKAWPYYSTSMKDVNNFFSIKFMGEDNKYVRISADDYGDFYVVDMGVEHNGKFIEEPIWDFIGRFCISKEDGDRLYELTKTRYDENAREISIDDIIDMSERKETDWKKFQQFLYEDTEIEEVVIKNGLESDFPVKFMIKDRNGYILVWYSSEIFYDAENDTSERYDEVLKAIIYNEKEESIDFYDENIESFMEETN